MSEQKPFAPAVVSGNTVAEVKRSAQFWLQKLLDKLNEQQGQSTAGTAPPVVVRSPRT